jgi:hypothetical protein
MRRCCLCRLEQLQREPMTFHEATRSNRDLFPNQAALQHEITIASRTIATLMQKLFALSY